MQIKRLDATPYLIEEEVVELKITAKKSIFNLIQTVLCYALWLIALAGDCFLLGMTSTLRESLNNVSNVLLPIIIVCTAVHIVPFAFWLIHALKAKQANDSKWYAVTNKRILIICGTQPVVVTFINLSDITSFKLGKSTLNVAIGEERVNLTGLENPKIIADKIVEIFENEREAKETSAKSAESENKE